MKTAEKITHEFIIANLPVKVEISRAGQCPASESDEVQAVGRLYLPKQQEPLADLHSKFHFGNRLSILGNYLHYRWGHADEKNTGLRYRTSQATAPTWREAMAKVEEELLNEVEKLANMVKAREAALLAAELRELKLNS